MLWSRDAPSHRRIYKGAISEKGFYSHGQKPAFVWQVFLDSKQEGTGAGGDRVFIGYEHCLRPGRDNNCQFGEQHNVNSFCDTVANTQQSRWDGL
ncbi:hypothetical protein StoSoilB20_12230 [Arthrobacter sp. StoSoilB20]|nr:hypothetical protein StoSoilB20_12230 [Arthrobacter sp. StoSoilB20]